MKENMIFSFDDFQYRRGILEKIIKIIDKQETVAQGEMLMFGDSLVEGIPAGYNFINNGIGGMTSGALLNNLDELVIKFEPSSVYLHVGTNDLGDTSMTSPKEIAMNVLKIFMVLKENLPNTKMNLISTLPCIDALDSFKVQKRGIRQNALHNVLNKEYQFYLSTIGVNYIDLNRYLYDEEGFVMESMYEDGLHLNESGYQHLIKEFKRNNY